MMLVKLWHFKNNLSILLNYFDRSNKIIFSVSKIKFLINWLKGMCHNTSFLLAFFIGDKISLFRIYKYNKSELNF